MVSDCGEAGGGVRIHETSSCHHNDHHCCLKRSGEAAGSLVSDYGEVVAGAGGGADVVVNLLAEVAGLQTMVKGLATALQTNLQGVGSQFTTVHQQALELQQRFESAFNDLNATVRSLHSQVRQFAPMVFALCVGWGGGGGASY